MGVDIIRAATVRERLAALLHGSLPYGRGSDLTQPLDDRWADAVVAAEGVAVTNNERMNRYLTFRSAYHSIIVTVPKKTTHV